MGIMSSYMHTFTISLCWFLVEVLSGQVNITSFHTIRDSKTVMSRNGEFEVGFFSPKNSSNRYLGIWYTKRDSSGLEVVWVANRDNPLNESSGVLKICEDGNLRILDGLNNSIWSSNLAAYKANDSVVRLEDTGNLVLTATGLTMWQSFDHPTDTFLPEMNFTIKASVAKAVLLQSWKTPFDPSVGNFTAGILTRYPPEIFVWDNGNPLYRLQQSNGDTYVEENVIFRLVHNKDGSTFHRISLRSKPGGLQHFVLDFDGGFCQRAWNNVNMEWESVWNTRQYICSTYGKCGEFGSCNEGNSPKCSCLKGFVPKNDTEWNEGNWSDGCVRRTPLQCGVSGVKSDGFLKLNNWTKIPDNAVSISAINESECSKKCKGNCSCIAYMYESTLGCLTWYAALIDILELPTSASFNIYIRLASSELGISKPQQTRTEYVTRKSNHWKIIVIALATSASLLLGVCVCLFWFKCFRRKHGVSARTRIPGNELGDLPRLELEKLVNATNNFHESNKLGRGGFGAVYKGILENGEEVAIKRLSSLSSQGLREFVTEVKVIVKLQHRNLVRLLGYCAELEEKMLVYEYMPKKSLDALLFHPVNQERLDWKTRFNIIQGICRGLLYLHRDSRLRIIHRDLKASNILLDGNLNPKISDFGMARIFGGNEDQADTNRVVGTYGYMSPEYAMEGRFSEKSDVFSFGVLLLEIVSGRKNGSFTDEVYFSLLEYTWKFWNEDDISTLIDPKIAQQCSKSESLRCIQVALLCVQELPEDRPNVSEIISMIDDEVLNLPLPKQPGFTQRRDSCPTNVAQKGHDYQSANLVSLSSLGAR